MLLRKMAGESSAAPYIPYSGQYRHTISQLRLIPDAPPVPMKWVITTRFLRYLSFLCQTSDSNNHYGATHQQLLKSEDKNLT